jgi:hypothetical protein
MVKNIYKSWKTTLIGVVLFSGAFYASFISGALEFLYGGAAAMGAGVLFLFAPDKIISFLKRKSRKV